MAHILIVYQHYLSEGEPGFSRINEYAERWVQQGHRVSVLAGQVNYLTGVRASRYRGQWLARETSAAGVRVFRSYTSGRYARSFSGRAWAYLSYVISAMSLVPFVGRCDVVLVSSPPLTVAIPGRAAALFHRAPMVFEVRDLWPASAVATGVVSPDSPLVAALGALERRAYRWARRINVLTPGLGDDIVRRGLASPDKVVMIPNGVDSKLFAPDPETRERWRSKLGWQGKFVVLYAGAHGLANNLFQLVDAARRLSDERDVLIASVGDGMFLERLREACRDVPNIDFLGAYPKADMPGIVNAADSCVAVLQRNETSRTAYPNKVFEYMACAKPVILGVEGIAVGLLAEAGAGVAVTPEDPDALADAVRGLHRDREACARYGHAGRLYVQRHFERSMLADRMLATLLEAAAS